MSRLIKTKSPGCVVEILLPISSVIYINQHNLIFLLLANTLPLDQYCMVNTKQTHQLFGFTHLHTKQNQNAFLPKTPEVLKVRFKYRALQRVH